MQIPISRLLLSTAHAALAASPLLGCSKSPNATSTAPSTKVGACLDDSVITTSVGSALDQATQKAGAANGANSARNKLRIKQ
jgi:hypothetical protein